MTAVLIVLGGISLIYGIYLHNFHQINKVVSSAAGMKNKNNKKEIEEAKPSTKEKSDGKQVVMEFAEVLKENLSKTSRVEDLQKDTLEKLRKESITLDEAAMIMKMEKGEVLLLKNIYVNYHQSK